MDHFYSITHLPPSLARISEAYKSYQAWSDMWMRAGWRVQENSLSGKTRLLAPNGAIAFSGDSVDCLARAQQLAPSSRARHAVILLHGMGRTQRAFLPLEARLRENGFAVVNIGYASLNDDIPTHLRRLRSILNALAEDGVQEVSFIGHSLGGLLVRRLLTDPIPVDPRALVMLGTPNHGSQMAAYLSRHFFFTPVFGDCGHSVTPQAVCTLPLPDIETIVIAGGDGRKGYNPLLQGDNDGVVTVEETRLDGREHFLRIPTIHTFLPTSKIVSTVADTFLKTGRIAFND